jgi:hypothetical protein
MRVEASGRQFIFPAECACCGGSADGRLTASASKTTGKKVVHTTTHTWDFPYCSRCLRHVRAAQSAVSVGIFLAALTAVLAVVLYLAVAPWLAVLVGIVGFVGMVMLYNKMMGSAKAACAPECACVSSAVAFLEWDGSRQAFEITSTSYAVAFMVANERKVVNLSPRALLLLEAQGRGSQAGGQQAARRYST